MRLQLNKTYEKNREDMNEYLKVEKAIETAESHSYPTT